MEAYEQFTVMLRTLDYVIEKKKNSFKSCSEGLPFSYKVKTQNIRLIIDRVFSAS